MKNPIVFMFSGQGSHYYQIGKWLYTSNATFKYWLQRADKIAISLLGTSLIDILYSTLHQKHDTFDQSRYTHPVIFIVQYALAKVLTELELQPVYLLGTSVGEFVSLAIANVISFEQALTAVISQALLIESHCDNAAMLAVLSPPISYQQEYYRNCSLASINFSNHFVVTGNQFHIQELILYLKQQQVSYQLLAVSHGFHSPLIDNAKDFFLREVADINLRTMTTPIISCVHGGKLENVSHNYLWEIVRVPIQFQSAITWLEQKGSFSYIDVGPSGTLANFVKYQLASSSQSTTHTLLTPFGKQFDISQWIAENFSSSMSF